MYKRVKAQIQQIGFHQGTEVDLDYELQTPAKAIYPKDYDLVIDAVTSAKQSINNFPFILIGPPQNPPDELFSLPSMISSKWPFRLFRL
ncbi:MAG: hypothetical protein ACXU9U_00985 [Parachlamydiaceae bacterium]